jgi:hypothetical protein
MIVQIAILARIRKAAWLHHNSAYSLPKIVGNFDLSHTPFYLLAKIGPKNENEVNLEVFNRHK